MSTSPNTALAVMPDYLKAPLAKFIGNPEFELILPSIPVGEPGFGMKPTVCIVQISGDPEAKEVFKVGASKGANGWEDKLAYTKQGLEKMADAAGITIRTRRTDDRKDPDYCEFEAVGTMRNAQGELMGRSGTAGIRVSQWREDRWTELQQQNERSKERKKSDAELKAALDGEMAQFRKHFISRCETKAALRVVRSFLAIKSGISRAEVERPKVLVRHTFQPDTSDPETRRAMVAHALNASSLLYGPQPGPSGSFAEAIDPPAPAQIDPPADEEREPGDVPPTKPAPAAAPSLMEQVMQGCKLLGVDPEVLIAKHKGDFAAALKDLNRAADTGDLPF